MDKTDATPITTAQQARSALSGAIADIAAGISEDATEVWMALAHGLTLSMLGIIIGHRGAKLDADGIRALEGLAGVIVADVIKGLSRAPALTSPAPGGGRS